MTTSSVAPGKPPPVAPLQFAAEFHDPVAPPIQVAVGTVRLSSVSNISRAKRDGRLGVTSSPAIRRNQRTNRLFICDFLYSMDLARPSIGLASGKTANEPQL